MNSQNLSELLKCIESLDESAYGIEEIMTTVPTIENNCDLNKLVKLGM